MSRPRHRPDTIEIITNKKKGDSKKKSTTKTKLIFDMMKIVTIMNERVWPLFGIMRVGCRQVGFVAKWVTAMYIYMI